MAQKHRQILLDKGLIDAAAACSMLKVRAALDYGANPNFQDPQQHGWAALHFACYFSKDKTAERICKTLLSRGAQPDMQALDGTTPLMAAASVGSIDAVRLLIDGKADANVPDKGGKTPLMGAADRGSVDVALALLAGGADPNAKDLGGVGAMELAHARGHHEVAAAIESRMLSTMVARRPSGMKR